MNGGVVHKPDRSSQFSVVAILLWVAALSVALKLALVFQAPGYFSAAVIALLAWLGARVGRLGKVSTTLAAIGTHCLVVAWLVYYEALGGLFADFPAYLLTVLGVLLLLLAALLFICQLPLQSTGTMPWQPMAAAVTCVVLLAMNFIVARPAVEDIRRAVWDQRAAHNAAISPEIVAAVEAICKKLGRSPEEQELVRLLGKPMPTIDCGDRQEPVKYSKTGPNSFRLEYDDCGFWGDIVTYDSTSTPRKWVRTPF